LEIRRAPAEERRGLPGLLVEEKADAVRFANVRRRPGAPTVVIPATFSRAEIARIDKLDPRDRARLRERVQALDPTGKGEAARMEALELKPAPWVRDGGRALSYRSNHFELISDAREPIVRRCAVRLEQIYNAYLRFLPPNYLTAEPTKILLFRSPAEYRALLKAKGRNILNPAFFDPPHNQILCASDLEVLGEALTKTRKHHRQLLARLQEEEAKVKKQFRGSIPASVRKTLDAKRKEIAQANAKNDSIFQAATARLFRMLYHEAFHAYLANYVFPPHETAVPRWLNEGLAQIFEIALVEAGELRVGHVDAERLTLIRAAARKGELLPLADLLRATPNQFVVLHTADRPTSERSYLNSWALAHYLTFDRQLLGTPGLREYVRSLKRGTPEVEAFRTLVGEPTERFEQEYRDYLRRLRADGTAAPRTPAVKTAR
jgi:hypothetical protein